MKFKVITGNFSVTPEFGIATYPVKIADGKVHVAFPSTGGLTSLTK
jgi:nitrite reductase/ring-hydroxylating ferredoxin subunit